MSTRDWPEAYIGDGVYANFDGYQIWIRAQRDNGWHRIALDNEVLTNLLQYRHNIERLRKTIEGTAYAVKDITEATEIPDADSLQGDEVQSR